MPAYQCTGSEGQLDASARGSSRRSTRSERRAAGGAAARKTQARRSWRSCRSRSSGGSGRLPSEVRHWHGVRIKLAQQRRACGLTALAPGAQVVTEHVGLAHMSRVTTLAAALPVPVATGSAGALPISRSVTQPGRRRRTADEHPRGARAVRSELLRGPRADQARVVLTGGAPVAQTVLGVEGAAGVVGIGPAAERASSAIDRSVVISSRAIRSIRMWRR
jgi:hypothetical protein